MNLKEVIRYAKLLHKKGFVSSSDGNISIRSKEGIFITPSGIPKRELKEKDLIFLKEEKKVDGASSETSLHLEIYKKRDDVFAIVHAHPPFTTALSLTDISYEGCPLSESIITLSVVKMVPFKMPGSIELAQETAKVLGKEGRAVILKNHGAVTVGSSLRTAYYRMEALEHSSKIFFLANLFGKVKPFDKKLIEKLLKISKEYGLK